MATRKTTRTAVKTTTAAKSAAGTTAAKTTEVKKTTKAATAQVKETAQKPEMETAVYIQYGDKEVLACDLLTQVKAVWTDELKKDIGDCQSVKMYVKPEEEKVYYVINEEVKGFIAF